MMVGMAAVLIFLALFLALFLTFVELGWFQ